MEKAEAKGMGPSADGLVETVRLVRVVDLRASGRVAREAVRARAYELFRQGAQAASVARALGVQAVTVCRWFKAFRAGDLSLLEGEGGRVALGGRAKRLDGARMEELRRILLDKAPIDCQIPYRRWSFAALLVEILQADILQKENHRLYFSKSLKNRRCISFLTIPLTIGGGDAPSRPAFARIDHGNRKRDQVVAV